MNSHGVATQKRPTDRLRVVLLTSSDRPDLADEASSMLPLVREHADATLGKLTTGGTLDASAFDLAMVFGGDGSILRTVRQMGRQQRPVVGVNLGKLGFLADLSPGDLRAQLPAICSGSLPVVEHLMFECQFHRDGKVLWSELGLNEVTVFAGPPFSIVEIHLYVDSELATTYSCDGLIVSTPVGSTAHNLSAGGPILRKDLQAFVISPISPHTLTNRPVVDSAERIYELGVSDPHPGTSVVVDGTVLAELRSGDRVRIFRAEPRFKLLAVPGHSYYRTLREKLGWGGKLPGDTSQRH